MSVCVGLFNWMCCGSGEPYTLGDSAPKCCNYAPDYLYYAHTMLTNTVKFESGLYSLEFYITLMWHEGM